MNRLSVEVVAPDHMVWSGEARTVVAPSSEGDVGILPGHVPILAVLRHGKVRIEPVEGVFEPLAVHGGFISVDGDDVAIFVELSETNELAGAEASESSEDTGD